MWEGLFLVLSLSTVMAVASFLVGSLPLSMSLSQKHSRTISAIGTGLLVGTCLIIIIPEGIETLYTATEIRVDTPRRRLLFARQADEEGSPTEDGPGSFIMQSAYADPHSYVGLALILGFILMYLIDQLPKHATAGLSTRTRPLQISLANLSQGPHRANSPSRVNGDVEEGSEGLAAAAQGTATTLGLVIHAAADGIALAASSFISKKSTGLIVFLAIMVHKAPAAFGLTSVLLKKGLTKRTARAHLIVFSLAAPVGAIATWILVDIVAGGHIEGAEGTEFFTGLLLLFSGGTFLYVAMHTMQETGAQSQEHAGNGYAESSTYTSSVRRKDEAKQPGLRDTMLAVVGMLLPLLATVGHAH